MLQDLPVDVLELILACADDISTTLSVLRTCHALHRLYDDTELWRSLCMRRGYDVDAAWTRAEGGAPLACVWRELMCERESMRTLRFTTDWAKRIVRDERVMLVRAPLLTPNSVYDVPTLDVAAVRADTVPVSLDALQDSEWPIDMPMCTNAQPVRGIALSVAAIDRALPEHGTMLIELRIDAMAERYHRRSMSEAEFVRRVHQRYCSKHSGATAAPSEHVAVALRQRAAAFEPPRSPDAPDTPAPCSLARFGVGVATRAFLTRAKPPRDVRLKRGGFYYDDDDDDDDDDDGDDGKDEDDSERPRKSWWDRTEGDRAALRRERAGARRFARLSFAKHAQSLGGSACAAGFYGSGAMSGWPEVRPHGRDSGVRLRSGDRVGLELSRERGELCVLVNGVRGTATLSAPWLRTGGGGGGVGNERKLFVVVVMPTPALVRVVRCSAVAPVPSWALPDAVLARNWRLVWGEMGLRPSGNWSGGPESYSRGRQALGLDARVSSIRLAVRVLPVVAKGGSHASSSSSLRGGSVTITSGPQWYQAPASLTIHALSAGTAESGGRSPAFVGRALVSGRYSAVAPCTPGEAPMVAIGAWFTVELSRATDGSGDHVFTVHNEQNKRVATKRWTPAKSTLGLGRVGFVTRAECLMVDVRVLSVVASE